MKKIDALVKRVEFFERLAVYGNRSSFLKSLAQEVDNSKALEVAAQILSVLQQAGVTDPEITNPFANARLFHKIDLGAMSKALSKAHTDPNLATIVNANKLGELRSMMSSLQAAYKTPDQAENEQAMAGPATYTFPGDKVTGFRPIPKDQQSALGRFVTVEGLGLPLKADGSLGPETRRALDAFKKYVTAKNPNKKNMSDDEALKMAKFIVDNAPDKYGKD